MLRTLIVYLVGATVLAGCATSVVGSPQADPSAAPRPETGSFSSQPRDVGPVNRQLGLILEGRRMAATAPLIPEINPDLRYRGDLETGKLDAIYDSDLFSRGDSLRGTFDTTVDLAMRAREVGFNAGASSAKYGALVDTTGKLKGATIGVLRMPSAEAAEGAVNSRLLDTHPDDARKERPAKVAGPAIPNYAKAITFTQDFKLASNSLQLAAFVAHRQYIIYTRGDFSPDQVRAYFDLQIKGLDAFKATPLDKVTDLPLDEASLSKYTVVPPSEARTSTGSVPARVALSSQSDILNAKQAFEAAGVDAVGFGRSTVYRARDAAGSQKLADAFVKEAQETYSAVTPVPLRGVPGGQCLSYKITSGSETTYTWCISTRGRFIAETSATQQAQAVQAIGASYLILGDAK